MKYRVHGFCLTATVYSYRKHALLDTNMRGQSNYL